MRALDYLYHECRVEVGEAPRLPGDTSSHPSYEPLPTVLTQRMTAGPGIPAANALEVELTPTPMDAHLAEDGVRPNRRV